MKMSNKSKLSALLGVLAVSLTACMQDGDVDSPDEHVGPAAAPLGAPAPGEEGAACPRDGSGRGAWGKGSGKHGRMFMARFDQADANQDGELTLQELADSRSRRFGEMDSDANGVVDQAELDALRDKHHAERFGELDADGDGFVALEEAPPGLAAHFAEIDANGDSKLSSDELRAAQHERGARRGGKGAGFGPDGDGPARDGRGLARHGEGRPAGRGPGMGPGMGAGKGPAAGKPDGQHPMLWGMDANDDGKISLDEMKAAEQRWFERLDADSDGVIRRDELGRRGRR